MQFSPEKFDEGMEENIGYDDNRNEVMKTEIMPLNGTEKSLAQCNCPKDVTRDKYEKVFERHMLGVHNVKEPYKCFVCSLQFDTISSL